MSDDEEVCGLLALMLLHRARRAARCTEAGVDRDVPRYGAVEAHLRERAGEHAHAARLYADAARTAPNVAERDHLTRQAARLTDLQRGGPA